MLLADVCKPQRIIFAYAQMNTSQPNARWVAYVLSFLDAVLGGTVEPFIADWHN
jgi:hypothetical protein